MEVSKEFLHSVLIYDEHTGLFTWRADRPVSHFSSVNTWKIFQTRFAGKQAGCTTMYGGNSYTQIRLDGKLYLAHRLAWLYVHGSFPEQAIDHLDGNGLNNSLANLRITTSVENGRNARRKKNNTSGVNGVWFHAKNNKWIAEGHSTESGRKVKTYLGSFSTLVEAEKERLRWESSQGNFSSRHGSVV